jgi:menaquinone-9 beta-reductase
VNQELDVAIVGASIAGCTAATLYGRAGLKVALIEKHSDPAAYKTVCTHFIQPSATPTLERLGVAEKIEAAGGLRNSAHLWTRHSGWVRPQLSIDYRYSPYGYNIRREKLDPMMRELAASTDGVELLLGHTATALVRQGDRIAGVELRDRDGAEMTVRARLVVAADGRDSKLAELSGAKTTVKPHERFFYWAYYRNLDLGSEGASLIWLLEPDCAYMFPNDDGLTLIGCMPAQSKLEGFKADREAAFAERISTLPDGPDLSAAERVSPLYGKLSLPNTSRKAAVPGLAFVGDAAIAADPVWGVGCGWALQSSEWLAEETAAPLRRGVGVDAALTRYAKRHRRALSGHNFFINDFSRAREMNPAERLVFKAAANDAVLAERFHAYGSRSIPPSRFFTPRTIGRSLWVAARSRNGRGRASTPAAADVS